MILNFCFLPLPEDECDSETTVFAVGAGVIGNGTPGSLGDLLGWDLVSSNLDSEINRKNDHEQLYATVPVDHM